MKRQRLMLCLIVATVVCTLAAIASASRAQEEHQKTSAKSVVAPTLNLNLGEPLTLDPAKATDTVSFYVIEQLFLGLVDLDDETGEVSPELATVWDISPDHLVYTFTLRSDVRWTDGYPVTAQDVSYGILRTLDPATASRYAPTLDMIKNAEAYRTGGITDPNQVGVKALDDFHLRVVLEQPTSYALSILSLPAARPMPRRAVESWGDAWAEPGRIVTNGPYSLAEWVHNAHLLLHKNAAFYGAEGVQIEQVRIWMVSDTSAWEMYMHGRLDTAAVPQGTLVDPSLRGEVHLQPRPCTNYLGFSLLQPPFDELLVRKAFIGAVGRQGLIDRALGGLQRPALTFTAPGIFGHVDGYAQGVGISHNPTQARDWLAQAGYPNGDELPPITLWFNVGLEGMAEYLQSNWYSSLGVSVTLHSLPWDQYLGEYGLGQFQIWRMAWCADYNDAHSFLSDGLDRGAMGYWRNPIYENLIAEAGLEQDPDVRRQLYKQAEKILVDTDAVMMPLFYSASQVATKPHLLRTFPTLGAPDIASWRIVPIEASPAMLTVLDLSRYSPRLFGSGTANDASLGAVYDAALYIKQKLESYGLQAWIEDFSSQDWNVDAWQYRNYRLLIDYDGDPATTSDRVDLTQQSTPFLRSPWADDPYGLRMLDMRLTAPLRHDGSGRLVLSSPVPDTWQTDFKIGTTNTLRGVPPLTQTDAAYSSWDLGTITLERPLFDVVQSRVIDDTSLVTFSYRMAKGTLTGHNVVGKIDGSDEREVVLTAHYDTIYTVGAIDNGSGVATLLEVARQLVGHQFQHDIYFVFVDGEEIGLWGSQDYVGDHASELDDAIANINVDCVASGSDHGMVVGVEQRHPAYWTDLYWTFQQESSPEVDEFMAEIASQQLGFRPEPCYAEYIGGASDFASFAKAGIPATNIFWIDLPRSTSYPAISDERLSADYLLSKTVDGTDYYYLPGSIWINIPYVHTSYDDMAHVDEQYLMDTIEVVREASFALAGGTTRAYLPLIPRDVPSLSAGWNRQ